MPYMKTLCKQYTSIAGKRNTWLITKKVGKAFWNLNTLLVPLLEKNIKVKQ